MSTLYLKKMEASKWMTGSTWESDILQARCIREIQDACKVEVLRLFQILSPNVHYSDDELNSLLSGETELYVNCDNPPFGAFARIVKIIQWSSWMCGIIPQ